MNILILNYEYPPIGAGAANASKCIANELVKMGNEVVVLTSGVKGNIGYSVEDGIHVYRLNAFRRKEYESNTLEKLSYMICAAGKVIEVASKHNIDASIAFFSIPSGPVALHLKNKMNIPYVVSLRGGDVPGLTPETKYYHILIKYLRRMVLRNAKAVIANDDGLKRLSEQADPYEVTTIPNGVDTDFYYPLDKLQAMHNGVVNFLFVGRFFPQKNISFLLKAYAEIVRKINKRTHLHIVGDGAMADDLKKESIALGLDKDVTWHGWLPKDKLRSMYQKCDCFINPSLYEGMPNTVLEAMACGLPVIASNISGNNKLVINKMTGYLFPLNTQDGLIGAMRSIVCDSSVLGHMGMNARRIATDAYAWAAVAKMYQMYFKEQQDVLREA